MISRIPFSFRPSWGSLSASGFFKPSGLNLLRGFTVKTSNIVSYRVITPDNQIPGLHFAAFGIVYPHAVIYARKPGGKLHISVDEQKWGDSPNLEKSKVNDQVVQFVTKEANHEELEWRSDQSFFEDNALPDTVSWKKFLNHSTLQAVHGYIPAYNLLAEVEEPKRTYREAVLSRFPWILKELDESKETPNPEARAFLSQIENGSPIKAIAALLEQRKKPMPVELIRKLAGIPTLEFPQFDWTLTAFSFSPSDENGSLYDPANKEYLELYLQFIRHHMVAYEKDPEEFKAMRDQADFINKILFYPTYPLFHQLAQLKLLMQPKKSWIDFYSSYRRQDTYFGVNRINTQFRDMLTAFSRHVILPELIRVGLNYQADPEKFEMLVLSIVLKALTEYLNLNQLLKLSDWWHKEIGRIDQQLKNNHLERSWPALAADFTFDRNKIKTELVKAFNGYHLVYLTTESALREEGQMMHHCGINYTHNCWKGKSHLVSMRNRSGVREATAELYFKDGKVGVGQLFALGNSVPSLEYRLLLKWYVEQLNEGTIPIHADQLAGYQLAIESVKGNAAHSIGFNPYDQAISQLAFDLYHKDFIRCKSIKTAKEWVDQFKVVEHYLAFCPDDLAAKQYVENKRSTTAAEKCGPSIHSLFSPTPREEVADADIINEIEYRR